MIVFNIKDWVINMNKKIKLLIGILILSLMAISSFATETASINISSKSVEESELSVIKELIVLELEKREVVITGGKAGIIYDVKVHKLNSKIIVAIKKIRTDNNAVIGSSMVSSESINEIDTIIPRMIEAVLEEKDFEDTAKYKSVTEKEAKNTVKKKSEILFGLGYSALMMPGMKWHRDDYDLFGGVSARISLEIEYFRIDLSFDVGLDNYDSRSEYDLNESSTYAFGFIGINYFFFDGDFSPFVGSGLGYGSIMRDREIFDSLNNEYINEKYENKGIFIPVTIGMEFFRLHDIRFVTQVQANIPLQSPKAEGDSYNRFVTDYFVPVYLTVSILYN